METHVHPRLVFHSHELDFCAALRASFRLIREAMCGLAGHDYLRRFAVNRIFLRCASCGHETPGWGIDASNRLPAANRRLARTIVDGRFGRDRRDGVSRSSQPR